MANDEKFSTTIAGKKLELSTGKLAQQADGSVTVQLGETMVLVTATASDLPKQDIDFLPLTIDVAEKFYSVGRLPGGFFKREGRPSMEAILSARLCDRPLRPLFPSGYYNDVQIIISVLSSDGEVPYQALGIIGASAALAVSDIPFESSVAGCVIGLKDGELIVNPTYQQLEESELDLTVAGTKEAIMMVEAGSNFVSEQLLVDALKLAQDTNGQIIDLIEQMKSSVGKQKKPVPTQSEEEKTAYAEVQKLVADKFANAITENSDKTSRNEAFKAVKTEVLDACQEHNPLHVKSALGKLEKQAIRSAVLESGIRLDGRKDNEIRDLSSEVSLLPRVHGSALFQRGETQILNAVTLAPIGEKQKIDGLSKQTEKRYLHHYNFPPFSVGEVGRFGFTGRREVGHGALAERAVLPVLPSEEDFPYAIRSVSEALGSNGSTSMASVCASSLALMDAGVPIQEAVAGIAMGLIKDDSGKFVVLTDIQGAEDHAGDMDFKVAGTKDGVTALQMDIKVTGITFEIMEQALEQAKVARMKILESMESTLKSAREEVNKYAPSVLHSSIPVDKIGALIGPGGANIRKLTEEYEVKIDVKEDGSLLIAAESTELAKKAEKAIKSITQDFELGQTYEGKVVRIVDFGAFVELAPGKDGLVHISEISSARVETVESALSVGEKVEAMVVKIDPSGRIDLSMRAVAEGIVFDKDNPAPFGRDRFSSRNGGGRDKFTPRGGGGGRQGNDRRRSNYKGGSGGGSGGGSDRRQGKFSRNNDDFGGSRSNRRKVNFDSDLKRPPRPPRD